MFTKIMSKKGFLFPVLAGSRSFDRRSPGFCPDGAHGGPTR